MENNKICPNCGINNKNNSNFCSNCGKSLIPNIVTNNEQNNIQNNSNINENNQSNLVNDSEGNKLGIIALILYFASSTLISFISFLLPSVIRDNFSVLAGICPLSGIVVMIIGRVKYPNNKLLKIVMWIIIVSIILSLIAVIVFIMWCYVTCSKIDTSGCH